MNEQPTRGSLGSPGTNSSPSVSWEWLTGATLILRPRPLLRGFWKSHHNSQGSLLQKPFLVLTPDPWNQNLGDALGKYCQWQWWWLTWKTSPWRPQCHPAPQLCFSYRTGDYKISFPFLSTRCTFICYYWLKSVILTWPVLASPIPLKEKVISPWLVWLSGLSPGLQTKGSRVQFSVRAHAWVAGQALSRGRPRANHTLMFLSLSSSLPLSKNK